MSYYLQFSEDRDKPKQISELMAGKEIPKPEKLAEVPQDMALVCVIHVARHRDLALVCHDQAQFSRHGAASDYPRTWMHVPWNEVVKNLGFDPRVTHGPSWVR